METKHETPSFSAEPAPDEFTGIRSGKPDALGDRLGAFRAGYRGFLREGRVLLTGHSHQAWPDAAREAMLVLFDDAARLADDKWGSAVFPKLESVLARVAGRMGYEEPEREALAIGRSTHELVFRLLSCFPLGKGTRIVTTSAEFHSLRRQLARLAEAGASVRLVEAFPRASLADRLLEAIEPGVDVVAFSAVLFEDAWVLSRLPDLLARAAEVGAAALVDAYHAFNVVPLNLGTGKGRDEAFVVAGGYKYAAFGEGLCWMRIPKECALRPLYTGWFADFASLESERPVGGAQVGYGPGGARFAGATFDASAIYRADAVLAHFDAFGLTPARLRAISLRQTRRILDGLDEAGLGGHVASAREDPRRGGFVAVRAPSPAAAAEVVRLLRERGVFVDARADLVRLGPAPYLRDDEIDHGVAAAAAALRTLGR